MLELTPHVDAYNVKVYPFILAMCYVEMLKHPRAYSGPYLPASTYDKAQTDRDSVYNAEVRGKTRIWLGAVYKIKSHPC
jgi:hypothetical protein